MTARITLILAALAAFAFATPALAEHHEGKSQGHGKGLEKAQKKMDKAKERAGEAREEAEEHAGEAREEAEERAEEAREHAEERAEEAREMGEEKNGKGRGEEMRARRDERKTIMEEAKSGAEPGTPRKGKKPWWRFWESDDDYEVESDVE